MSKILVSGLLNIETNVNVHNFPVEYCPIDYAFFGVESDVSGVAYNVSAALKSLGDDVCVSSLIGNDIYKNIVLDSLKNIGCDTNCVKAELPQTPTSVVLYDDNGKRKIYCDLKDIQDRIYPLSELESAVMSCDGLVLCNINFNDELIKNAKQFNKPVFSDVHVLSDIHDSYNARFMQNADVLFLSDEGIGGSKAEFLKSIYNEYHNSVIVLGCGSQGAMMLDGKSGTLSMVSSVYTRPVVNTCGAGDSLFSCFVHEYMKGKAPLECLKSAVTFASYKIGESGGAKGFANEDKLSELCAQLDYTVSML